MNRFRKILFVSYGVKDEMAALKQALSLARNNEAELGLLIVAPRMPESLGDYADRYVDFLEQQLRQRLRDVALSLDLEKAYGDAPVAVECGEAPAIRVVRRVLREGHDLIVKEAEPVASGERGFQAMDMELLRKCPCPVWLSRPIERSRGDIRVAVAIDPESEEKAGRDLAIRLLKLARSLADTCSGRLEVVSCWNFDYEEFLRISPFARESEQQIAERTTATEQRHMRRLKALIDETDIDGDVAISHLKGRPEQLIPAFVTDKQIDILVMGTVARTGIPGLSMGNTAENILRALDCSLLALKPEGFVSNVKPD